MENGRSIVEKFWGAVDSNDFAALGALYAEDAVQEWPQSGERVVGRANIIAINQSYPGLPVATVRRVTGSDDVWVSEVSLSYGRDRYECVSVFEVSGGMIVRETDYFAAPFEPPQWRSAWTERS
ncbi:MAG: nuclear transport factor 2 family protein [Actinomycetota bacterium]|nr:nuclear transport factor 2 family protein [Actinomycetota bacterium]